MPPTALAPIPTSLVPAPAPRETGLTPEALYRRHQALVYRICYRYAKNRDDALDLVQDVFASVTTSLKDFEGLCQPVTWIYRIAVNRCLAYLHAQKRENENTLKFLEHCQLFGGQAGGEGALSKMLSEKVLNKVNHITRRILVLYFEEGLNQGQIAELMGVSRVAITRRLSKLKRQMSKWRDDFLPQTEAFRAGEPEPACEYA